MTTNFIGIIVVSSSTFARGRHCEAPRRLVHGFVSLLLARGNTAMPGGLYTLQSLPRISAFQIFTARRYASTVYTVVVCLSVCHTPILYQNG